MTTMTCPSTHCAGGNDPNWKGEPQPCRVCQGKGTIEVLPDALLDACRARGGRLRTHRPAEAIQHFVWRLARFHSGADVTMPVMSYVEIGCGGLTPPAGSPKRATLDALEAIADGIAKELGGTNMAAALKWGRAFGRIS